MIFVRNPHYWGAPRPYVDQVVSKIVADESQRINTFASEGDNLMFIATPQNADAASKKGGIPVPIVLNGGLNMYFNTRQAPFNDIRVRQAVAMGIDRADYAKVLYGGLIEPLDSIFRHDSPFYDPTITELPYDPVKAQQLFDQVTADTGKPIEFTLSTFTATNYATAAQYVQGVLNKYRNVKVSIVQESGAVHNRNCTTGAFSGACMHGPIFDDPEPLWTGAYECNANPSVTGWCNTKFDGFVEDQRQTLDPAKRVQDIKEAQKIFYAEVPALHLERRYSYMVVGQNVQDFAYVNDGLPLLDRIWLKTH
jgi:peptide/nickel transport system substrate-binding protein